MTQDPDLRELDPDDVATGQAIVALQRASYAVESMLIGSDGIPALTETLDQVRASSLAAGRRWLGAFDPSGLCGAVAWDELEDGTVDISRLVVAPRAFRRGVASRLLDALDDRFPGRPMVVSTGRANAPAIALYRRRGFHVVAEREAIPGLWVTELERRPSGG